MDHPVTRSMLPVTCASILPSYQTRLTHRPVTRGLLIWHLETTMHLVAPIIKAFVRWLTPSCVSLTNVCTATLPIVNGRHRALVQWLIVSWNCLSSLVNFLTLPPRFLVFSPTTSFLINTPKHQTLLNLVWPKRRWSATILLAWLFLWT
jgi:hypothetical protein